MSDKNNRGWATDTGGHQPLNEGWQPVKVDKGHQPLRTPNPGAGHQPTGTNVPIVPAGGSGVKPAPAKRD